MGAWICATRDNTGPLEDDTLLDAHLTLLVLVVLLDTFLAASFLRPVSTGNPTNATKGKKD